MIQSDRAKGQQPDGVQRREVPAGALHFSVRNEVPRTTLPVPRRRRTGQSPLGQLLPKWRAKILMAANPKGILHGFREPYTPTPRVPTIHPLCAISPQPIRGPQFG